MNENNNSINSKIKNNTCEELIKSGYRYPTYPNHSQGKFLLYYIREYLISKKKELINVNILNKFYLVII